MKRFVELFLALRFLRPTRSFVSAITVLSLLGVMFGVMVLIVVLSVMEGFESELQKKVIGFNAHLTVTNFGILKNYESIQNRLEEEPEVAAVSPFVVGPVLTEFHGKVATPFIKGIRPEESEAVIPMQQYLKQGEWLSSPETIVVGEEWARQNDARLGDVILIHSPKNLRRLTSKEYEDEFYLPNEYRIAGIYSTGMFEYDFNFLLIPLQEAQRLYTLDKADGVHGLAVRLKNPEKAAAVKERFNQWLPAPARALTWMDQNKRLFSAIALERRVMSFLLFFVMLVAAFGLSSTLITITVQKAREIGVMKALGATEEQIVSIFTLYGFIVGILGASLGVAGGLWVVSYRNDFSDWLAGTFGIEVFPAEIYNFSEIPAIVDGHTIFWIAAAGVLLSTLAALLPAAAAARFNPAEILRRE